MRKLPPSPIVKTGLPCLDEITCGSSDARALREDNSSFCFSCATSFRADGTDTIFEIDDDEGLEYMQDNNVKDVVEDINGFRSYAMESRKISKEVVDYFGVKMETGNDGSQPSHFYPYTQDGRVVGYKKRVLPKSFSFIGNSISTELFGQAQATRGKTLVITEGEIDAMAVAEAYIQQPKRTIYAIVAVPSASAKSAILAQREFINRFEKVIVMVDQDDAGDELRNYLCKIIRPGKAYIAKLPEKDASETLIKHGAGAIYSEVWNAQEWSPAGIVKGNDIWEQYQQLKSVESIPFPECLGGLNYKVKGIRQGEITLFSSGTGSGKSTVIKEMILNLLDKTQDKIGLVSLEESPADTAKKLMGMHIQKNLTEITLTEAEEKEAFDAVFADERLVLLDHQGAMSDESIIDKLDYLALMGCKYLIIDHITILVSEGADGLRGNEATDRIMSELLKLVKRHNIWIGVISHLRKSPMGGKSFEDGEMPNLDDLKGSGSLKQIAFDVIAFARNMNAEEEATRNSTRFAVLKSRFTGNTGPAGTAVYDPTTTRLHAGGAEEFDAVDELFEIKEDF